MTWDEVMLRLDEVVADAPGAFEADTIQNARDFLTAARLSCGPPVGVDQGYWPTFRLSWSTVEFEVFADHLEVYRADHPPSDIRHVPHVPGAAFGSELLDELLKP